MRHTIIGLDISKNKIDCCIDCNGEQRHIVISNDSAGYLTLIEHLDKADDIHACCEATNTYWRGIATFLHNRKYRISVVNPASIKAYAKLMLKRIKTDKQDAKLIADYCRLYAPQAWQPESVEQTALKNLHRRTEQLNTMLVMETNRLKVADSETEPYIAAMLVYIRAQIQACRDQMQNLIDRTPELKHKQQLMQTVPGIGKTTAQALLSVMADIDRYPTAKHLISWLGLSPVVRQSGKSQGLTRVSKMGSKSLRKALYMPARAACTKSKLWRGWFDYQIQRGKHPKQVYVMMMAKIIKYAYVCLKTDRPFDADLHKKRLGLLQQA